MSWSELDERLLEGKWQDESGAKHTVLPVVPGASAFVLYTSRNGVGNGDRRQIRRQKRNLVLDGAKLLSIEENKIEWKSSRKTSSWTRIGKARDMTTPATGAVTAAATAASAGEASAAAVAPTAPAAISVPKAPKAAATAPSAPSRRDVLRASHGYGGGGGGGLYGRRYNRVPDSDSDGEDYARSASASYPLVALSVASALSTPSRLTEHERKRYRVVTNCLKDSDYADVVDVDAFVPGPDAGADQVASVAARRRRVIHNELRRVTCALYITAFSPRQPGAGVGERRQAGRRGATEGGGDEEAAEEEEAATLEEAVQRVRDNELGDAIAAFKRLAEIARRYKIANPEARGAEYGKLLYTVQDFYLKVLGDDDGEEDDGGEKGEGEGGGEQAAPLVSHVHITTIADRMAEHGVSHELLSDPRIAVATTPVPRLSCTSELNEALNRKMKVVKQLAKKYAAQPHCSESKEHVKQVMYALDDRNVGVAQNAAPVATMIALLKKYFSPGKVDECGLARCLAIHEGVDGSRLTHEHEKQYHYVLQSLTFWKHVLTDMSHLWVTMEGDMLQTEYTLAHTGQGVNRIVHCPALYKEVQAVLEKAKQELGGWVGSSRIHMGDHQVPNGLHFIDKYTQIPSILQPILRTLSNLDAIKADDPVEADCISKVCVRLTHTHRDGK